MNYIIFDLELNSKPFKNRHPNEIIEIGAVKLNAKLEISGEFQAFIKPRVYRKLFPIVKRKTCISQEDISNADYFKEVLNRFRAWAGDEYILCCWGHDDIHHMKSNCEFNRRGIKWLKDYIDIQKQVSRIFNLPLATVFSLKNALEELGITVDEKLHRADTDARYTAQIFVKVFDKLDLGSI